MRKALKALACFGLWLFITLMAGAVGAWWPIRNVEESWAGDGLAMMAFGAFGLLIGAVLGVIAVCFFLRAISHRRQARTAPAVITDEGVWPPPPDTPATSPKGIP